MRPGILEGTYPRDKTYFSSPWQGLNDLLQAELMLAEMNAAWNGCSRGLRGTELGPPFPADGIDPSFRPFPLCLVHASHG